MKTEILYEDEAVLVIRKPAGLATQTAKVGEPDVVSELKKHLKGGYVGVVHRLDQPVEGLLVFGKTQQATAKLSAARNSAAKQEKDDAGGLNKEYLAVVLGTFEEKQGKLVHYLRKTPQNMAEVVPVVPEEKVAKNGGDASRKKASRGNTVSRENSASAQPKYAALTYQVLAERTLEDKVLENQKMENQSPEKQPEAKRSEELQASAKQLKDYSLSLVQIQLETGRFHQIRAQMAASGHPLLGDRKYGNAESQTISTQEGVRFVALCANRITFCHPVTGKEMTYETKPGGKIFTL